MKLIHYADHEVSGFTPPTEAQKISYKPRGLWVSDDADSESNWETWCRGEDFALQRLTHVHEIEISGYGTIAHLRNARSLDAFHDRYKAEPDWARGLNFAMELIDWRMVVADYQGIVISPYIWERRLDGPANNWYYGWDCASGCLWGPSIVVTLRLRCVRDMLEVRGDPFMPNYPRMLASGEYDWS